LDAVRQHGEIPPCTKTLPQFRVIT